MAVIYIDMDCFFAACEELRNPKLKGKPFIVGTHTEREKFRGVVQTCSYEARKYGIRSAMPVTRAFGLCQELVYVPDDFKYYEEMSKRVMDLVKGQGFPVEQDSIDEAAIDTGSGSYEEARRIGERIKAGINSGIGLPCTVGISYGKYLAKMACDASKPNGFGIVKEEGIHSFLGEKPVGKLPGVGERTESKLRSMGIETIGQLARANPVILMGKLGSAAAEIQQLANGIDDSRVVASEETLSIGRQKTLSYETTDMRIIGRQLKELSSEVAKEASLKGFRFKNVGVMVRYSDFTQLTKSTNARHYSSSGDDIYKEALALVKGLVSEKKVRKVGVRVSALLSIKGQRALF